MSKKAKSKTRKPRAKQNELALTGVGVEVTTDKKLIELGDAFQSAKDDAREAKEELKKLDAEILNRMAILGLTCFKIDGTFWRIDEKRHVKVTKLKDNQVEAIDRTEAAATP